MNKTLFLYDEEGYIYVNISGEYRIPVGNISALELDNSNAEGKIIKSINPTTKELITEDRPKTSEEQIKELQEQVKTLTQANAELTNIVAMGSTNA